MAAAPVHGIASKLRHLPPSIDQLLQEQQLPLTTPTTILKPKPLPTAPSSITGLPHNRHQIDRLTHLLGIVILRLAGAWDKFALAFTFYSYLRFEFCLALGLG